MNNMIKSGPTKTFQQEGKWVLKPSKTQIMVCECGTKYIKTRKGQTSCLRCMRIAKGSNVSQ